MLSQRTARLTSSLIRDILAAQRPNQPGMFVCRQPAGQRNAGAARLEDVPDGVIQYGPVRRRAGVARAVAERARHGHALRRQPGC